MTRVRFALALAVAAMAVCRPAAARAQDVGAQECCQTLPYQVAARVVALGTAVVARAMPDALYLNPAAISELNVDEFRVHSERSEDTNTTAFGVAFGLSGVGTAAITFRLLDYGDIPTRDENDNPTGSTRTTDNLFSATFATSVLPHVAVGVTYKLFQERHDCTGQCSVQSGSGTTNAIDLGWRLDVPWVRSLQVGMSATQLGLPLQVRNAAQRDPAPTRLRVGAAYEVLQHFRPDSMVQLVASVDVQRGIRDGVESRAGTGLELVLEKTLFVRAGYAWGPPGLGTGGAVGVGMTWDRFDVSVAKSFASGSPSTEPFQVTFALRF